MTTHHHHAFFDNDQLVQAKRFISLFNRILDAQEHGRLKDLGDVLDEMMQQWPSEDDWTAHDDHAAYGMWFSCVCLLEASIANVMHSIALAAIRPAVVEALIPDDDEGETA